MLGLIVKSFVCVCVCVCVVFRGMAGGGGGGGGPTSLEIYQPMDLITFSTLEIFRSDVSPIYLIVFNALKWCLPLST